MLVVALAPIVKVLLSPVGVALVVRLKTVLLSVVPVALTGLNWLASFDQPHPLPEIVVPLAETLGISAETLAAAGCFKLVSVVFEVI